MKILLIAFFFIFFTSPTNAVTTKMFKVLDTCARYRLNEINVKEAIEKLKLKPIQHIDTAGAAYEVANENDISVAAIASKMAGEIYGLKVLKKNPLRILDSKNKTNSD